MANDTLTNNVPTVASKSFVSFLQGTPKDTSKPVIGILYAKKGGTKTNRYGTHVFGVMEQMGYNTAAIDYLEIYDSATRKTNRHFQTRFNMEGTPIPEQTSQEWKDYFQEKLPGIIRNVLQNLNIDGIIAPGDWYNYDSPPFHPSEKRPVVSSALFKTVMEDKKIALKHSCIWYLWRFTSVC